MDHNAAFALQSVNLSLSIKSRIELVFKLKLECYEFLKTPQTNRPLYNTNYSRDSFLVQPLLFIEHNKNRFLFINIHNRIILPNKPYKFGTGMQIGISVCLLRQNSKQFNVLFNNPSHTLSGVGEYISSHI